MAQWLAGAHHPRHVSSLPVDRRSGLPWLVVPGAGVLISPWRPCRARGLSDAERTEIEAVRSMLSRLTLPKRADGCGQSSRRARRFGFEGFLHPLWGTGSKTPVLDFPYRPRKIFLPCAEV
jgi:hypothetical protein